MYADLKKRTLRKRKKAIAKQMPLPFLKLADYYIDMAIFFRTRKDTKASGSNRNYSRALTLLLSANDVLDAHLLDRFSCYEMHLLADEI